ncbi:MAG TPA: hypothetical protein VF520_12090 [Thermoleophilaceae bacterium]|jgi:hypothetical protein
MAARSARGASSALRYEQLTKEEQAEYLRLVQPDVGWTERADRHDRAQLDLRRNLLTHGLSFVVDGAASAFHVGRHLYVTSRRVRSFLAGRMEHYGCDSVDLLTFPHWDPSYRPG